MIAGLKTRSFPDKNYRSIYFNGKTLRQSYDSKKPIRELDYPEFYDVKITNKCDGKCIFCYQDSTSNDQHFDDILNKINNFFGKFDENQKPFQVAIGGGEPTSHPDFIRALELFHKLGITPNYTTNGMFITDADLRNKVMKATIDFCGGVAVSCHPHLREYWEMATNYFISNKVKLNFHIIISDKTSIDYFLEIYKEYKEDIDYFVLLPYIAQGRATKKDIETDYLFDNLKKLNSSKIAFGALFYESLKTHGKGLDISLYEPEIMSKYLDLKDMRIYKSSFNLDKE